MNRAARLSAILERSPMAVRSRWPISPMTCASAGHRAARPRHAGAATAAGRTHGGAIAHAVSYELPLRYKGVRHAEDKRRIAREAAAYVSEGMAIGLTGGTTATRSPGTRRPAEADDRDERPQHRVRAGRPAQAEADRHRRRDPQRVLRAVRADRRGEPGRAQPRHRLHRRRRHRRQGRLHHAPGDRGPHERRHDRACPARRSWWRDSPRSEEVAFARICESRRR